MACKHCGSTEVDKDPARGDAVCMGCGNVLEDTLIVSEVQFAENAGGGSSVIGQFVSSEGGSALPMTLGSGFPTGIGRESRTVTLQKGRAKINELSAMLKLNQHCCDTAFNFYKMAVSRRLTRGRKSAHVIAACVYLVCRTEGTAHMLLDFSDVLQINVYTLGKTYLALSRLLCINVPAIDPCLLIPRFAHKLDFGEKEHDVSMTAMRLVSRMKRDWMAIGRRPSGLCGAALLVASRIHNFCRFKSDIVKVVKVCEGTLRKRLVEFEETASGLLTIDEFQTVDLEEEADPPCFTKSRKEAKLKQYDELTGEFSGEITDLSKQIDQELETRASKQAMKLEQEANAMLNSAEVIGEAAIDDSNARSFLESEIIQESMKEGDSIGTSSTPIHNPCMRPTAASLGLMSTSNEEETTLDDNPSGELDLTGINDDEIDKFILTDSERKMKERVWMSLNGEFLKEMEEKARKKAEEEAAKPPKVRKKRRKAPINAASAGEAVEKMLQEKKISSKINYDILRNLTDSLPSSLVKKTSLPAGQPSTSAAASPQLAAQSATPADYLPGVIDETGVSVKKRRLGKPPENKSNTGSISQSDPATSTETPAAVIDSEPVVESGPVQSSQADEELEEELYNEDEDEPVSAAQLLGHGYSGDYEEDEEYD